MKLPNKVYDIIKYICLIAVPAFIWYLTELGTIWGFDAQQVIQTIAATATFVGILLGWSSLNYKKSGMTKMFNDDLLKEMVDYTEPKEEDEEVQ